MFECSEQGFLPLAFFYGHESKKQLFDGVIVNAIMVGRPLYSSLACFHFDVLHYRCDSGEHAAKDFLVDSA
jgi:hypothetical protein